MERVIQEDGGEVKEVWVGGRVQQHVEAASDELACRVALIVSNLHGVSWLR
ncbi:hypothetical protein BgiBS90_015717, partial [Biomphalaria glabrata]